MSNLFEIKITLNFTNLCGAILILLSIFLGNWNASGITTGAAMILGRKFIK